jgi:hypothetical protein
MVDQDPDLEPGLHSLTRNSEMTFVDSRDVRPCPSGPFHLQSQEKIPEKGKETAQFVASLQ